MDQGSVPQPSDRHPLDELVGDVLFAEPPRLLYHYTSQAGLLGIATTRTLRATNMAYLNDLSEYEYGSRVIRTAIETRRGADTAFVEETEASLKAKARDFCLTAFTGASDLLSQWRGYANDGNGYCLGFDAASIRARAGDEEDWFLTRCEYDPDRQQQLANALVDSWFASWQREGSQPRQGGFWENFFGPSFGHAVAAVVLAFSFKHPSFSEEREWRLVMETSGARAFRFRTGKSMITPYREFDLRGEEGKRREVALRRVIVGPNPQPELAADAVGMLLEAHDFRDVEVVPSVIPFRIW
jgi:hypothetical protein